MIKLIYASDLNGLIGKGDKLPWNIPSELAFFFEMTKQGTLLFGLNTFKSLPSNFQKQDRKIILSLIGLNNTEEQLLNLKNQADLIIYTEQEMLSLFLSFQNSKENLFICGGKEIYTRYYFWADQIWLSLIKNTYQGDVYFDLLHQKIVQKENKYQSCDDFDIYQYDASFDEEFIQKRAEFLSRKY